VRPRGDKKKEILNSVGNRPDACILTGAVKFDSPGKRPIRLAYQPNANITFLSEQISHQQLASSIFLSKQISTSYQPPAKRTG
jgi:hypothetical protein